MFQLVFMPSRVVAEVCKVSCDPEELAALVLLPLAGGSLSGITAEVELMVEVSPLLPVKILDLISTRVELTDMATTLLGTFGLRAGDATIEVVRSTVMDTSTGGEPVLKPTTSLLVIVEPYRPMLAFSPQQVVLLPGNEIAEDSRSSMADVSLIARLLADVSLDIIFSSDGSGRLSSLDDKGNLVDAVMAMLETEEAPPFPAPDIDVDARHIDVSVLVDAEATDFDYGRFQVLTRGDTGISSEGVLRVQ